MRIRSQSWNTARDLVGWQQFINQYEPEDFNCAFYVTPEYTRSMKPCRIASYLFGKAYTGGSLTISGSRVKDRGQYDFLADYFGLPTDFLSTVRFKPRVSNFLVDLGVYFGLDNVCDGMYFRVHAPMVHSMWKLDYCETVSFEGVNGYDEGYMDSTAVTNENLAKKWSDSSINGIHTWGDMTEALQYTKINSACCKRTKTKLSDLQMALGWNFFQAEDRHMGLHILAGFPTAGKHCCEYVFSPVIGNGGHFELGAGVTASSRLWMSDDEERSLWVYVDANAAHLFKRRLLRTFDLIGKKDVDRSNSRYMLVQEMTSLAENLYTEVDGSYPASTFQYSGKLLPLANITTCCADISIAVQGEFTAKFTYNTGRWSFDLGYNLWGRTGETICACCKIPSNKYALKGDAFIVGFGPGDDTSGLAATESDATIYAGTNTPYGTDYVENHKANPSIDPTAALAWYNDGVDRLGTDSTRATQTRSSTTPIFLSCNDLDTRKTPAALSHKIFAHLGYAWNNDAPDDRWTPFLGIGGEAEFSGRVSGVYTALSQWGFWLKGGLAFE